MCLLLSIQCHCLAPTTFCTGRMDVILHTCHAHLHASPHAHTTRPNPLTCIIITRSYNHSFSDDTCRPVTFCVTWVASTPRAPGAAALGPTTCREISKEGKRRRQAQHQTLQRKQVLEQRELAVEASRSVPWRYIPLRSSWRPGATPAVA